MKTITRFLSVVAGIVLIANTAVAQETLKHCGNLEATQKLYKEHPELVPKIKATTQQLDQFTQQYIHDQQSATNKTQATTTYVIPIVFHILHEYGSEDISDAQIYDEVRILNEDYNHLNPDTSDIIPSFKNIAGNVQIQFRLARIDPNGNCTDGIDRIVSPLTNNADDNSKLDDWPRSKYLNVWVVKSIGAAGAAGYSYLPPQAQWMPSADGVLILSTYIGSIGTGSVLTSRALTHEIGHFLNLEHPWGSTNQPGVACGDDGVSDTPITKGFTSCPSSPSAAEICNPPTIENYQNFMDYSYCSKMFTQGQVNRMHAALNSTTASRNNLWSQSNLVATGTDGSTYAVCAPKADFIAQNNVTSVCAGTGIKFDDKSWNGHPTSWNWSFPGGTPSSSTDSMPTIVYNTPGTYDVTLTVSNGSGSDTKTRTSYITIGSDTAQYSSSIYTEGFETGTFPNSDWSIVNPDGDVTWAKTTSAASSGSASMMINNLSNTSGRYDELISPSVNLSKINNPTLSFEIAYTQKTTSDNDQFQVYMSQNCGQTWLIRYNKMGSTLSTTGGSTQSSTFVPNASQWSKQTINLSGFGNATNAKFMFKFTSGGGNDFYIDDINIADPNGIEELSASNVNFNVYPNPVKSTSVVSFYLDSKRSVSLKVYDMLGKEVKTIVNGNLTNGKHQYTIGSENLAPGIYILKLEIDNHLFIKKLVK